MSSGDNIGENTRNDADRLALGFDVGSVALKLAVTDLSGKMLHSAYVRTQGQPLQTVVDTLREILDRYDPAAFDLVAGTGSAGRAVAELLDVPFVNEVICQATAIRHLRPEVLSLIEMGGQDSKLILLPEPPSNGTPVDSRPMVDFSMNTNCAAGTGSFLDQQASRLGVRIEDEFGELALKCDLPPRVAGRCSVFAKSDMIHLQQKGASVAEIVAGLCMGLARNLKSNLSRGVELPRPMAFCGGVASNAGVVHAIEEVFGLGPCGLIVPDEHAVTGALGAILVTIKERHLDGRKAWGRPAGGRFDLAPLERSLAASHDIGHRLDQLKLPSDGQPDGSLPDRETLEAMAADGPIDAYLGLDVGSISTKVAVIDNKNRVLAKIYLMTAGRPMEAVQQTLTEIDKQVGGLVRIRGAATTGSGRYLTGDFIGADVVINEITAQATAAAAIDPEVDTIFEIGGQDSKYIGLDGGVVVDFEMNHACAAGTGSFLEEQAERLGISIKEQFSRLALDSARPIRLGERCTVFMESDLLSYQQQQARTDDLVSGLCYSIVSNYINRVVGNRKIGQRIFFQGGTAFNLGVTAAFEKVTGRRITVPPHHEVTGAIGAAILARRHQQKHDLVESRFGGFALAGTEYSIRSFECEHCSNSCEINEVTIAGREPLYYGSRCDRYNITKDTKQNEKIPNLFAERQHLLLEHARSKVKPAADAPTIGIPLALSNYQLLPFWGTLLGELGANVVTSGRSTRKVMHRGVELVLSTPCFPVKVAHGHVLELIDKGVDYVWMPSVVNMAPEMTDAKSGQLCPYVTAIPYQVSAAIEAHGTEAEILRPAIRLGESRRSVRKSLESTCDQLNLPRRRLRHAIDRAFEAQEAFEEACRERGRDVLEGLSPRQRAVVVVSRPYNGCDAGVSLDLPGKLRKMGVLAIPMDFLDLRRHDRQDRDDYVFRKMYWKYGQRILNAADIIREDPRLSAIYLSNFSCGPDSFIIGYFKRIMAPKPSLVLEIDEHSADAGVVTRLEAFWESLNSAPSTEMEPRETLYPLPRHMGDPERVVHVHWMGDISYALAAAFRACGQPATVLPIGDEKSIELGRRCTSGKECLPCILMAGDMIRLSQQEDFDPKRTAFFMPSGSGPCRFGQYNCVHKLILKDLGLEEIPIWAPSQDKEFYQECNRLGSGAMRMAWTGACVVDTLLRACLAVRPYEKQPGATDEVYQRWLELGCGLLETRPSTGDLAELLQTAVGEFMAIDADRTRRRPLIGVLGEIYVRHHDFANNDVLRMLEGLGAEATLAGFPEWMYYTNWLRKTESARHWKLRPWLTNLVEDKAMRSIHQRFLATLEPLLGEVDEAPIEKVLELAAPYIDSSFEGEAVLSVGKMIEFRHEGCHGVVNAMPFSCMPSTVVGGVMKKLTGALGDMPTLSISYDGQQDPMLRTRLEAFIHQARAYQTSRDGRSPIRIDAAQSPRRQTTGAPARRTVRR